MAKQFELLSPNYLTIYHTMTADKEAGSHGSVGTSGVGETEGFLLNDAKSGNTAVMVVQADLVRAEKVKGSGKSLDAGAPAYMVVATGKIDVKNPGAGKKIVGIIAKDAQAGDTHVNIIFDGRANFLKAN